MAQPVNELAKDGALRLPAAIALRCGHGRVSYAVAAAGAAAFGAALRVALGERVAARLPASHAAIAPLPGARSAGCAFVALDPAPDVQACADPGPRCGRPRGRGLPHSRLVADVAARPRCLRGVTGVPLLCTLGPHQDPGRNALLARPAAGVIAALVSGVVTGAALAGVLERGAPTGPMTIAGKASVLAPLAPLFAERAP